MEEKKYEYIKSLYDNRIEFYGCCSIRESKLNYILTNNGLFFSRILAYPTNICVYGSILVLHNSIIEI